MKKKKHNVEAENFEQRKECEEYNYDDIFDDADEEDFDYKNPPSWAVINENSNAIPDIEPSEDDNRYNDHRVYDDDVGYDGRW